MAIKEMLKQGNTQKKLRNISDRQSKLLLTCNAKEQVGANGGQKIRKRSKEKV